MALSQTKSYVRCCNKSAVCNTQCHSLTRAVTQGHQKRATYSLTRTALKGNDTKYAKGHSFTRAVTTGPSTPRP